MTKTQFPTVSELQKLTLTELDKVTRTAVSGVGQRRLLIGRCLLVLGQDGRVEQFGCSGAIHYAGLLKVSEKEAAECRRVARALEHLPLLRAAAETGRIGWCALSRITQKASPETDARWLELAERYAFQILKKLVDRTSFGETPADPDLAPAREAEEGWLHLRLPAHVIAMFQRALRQVSMQARTPVSVATCFELAVADHLAGAGNVTAETLEKMKAEARKDVAARNRPVATQMLLEEDEAPEAPVEALAGRGAICPSQPDLRLVVPDTDTDWQNPRLRFSGEARLTTPAQRQEVMRRDGYCCSTPGCPHKLWLDVHHIVFYCQGGVTLPENLIVVCTRCHRNIHKGRLKVTGNAPDGLHWRTRKGHGLDRPLPLELEESS